MDLLSACSLVDTRVSGRQARIVQNEKREGKKGRLQQLQRRRTLKAFGMQFGTVQSNVQLTAPKIGLTGKLDMLVTHSSKRIPAEIKFTNGPVD